MADGGDPVYRWTRLGLWDRILSELRRIADAKGGVDWAVKRSGPGRPKLRPRAVVGDRGYTGRPVRDHLRRHGVSAVIPQLKTEKAPRLMDWGLYRERNVVERLVGRLGVCS